MISNTTNIVSGVPSTVLLPSKRDKWEFVSGPHAIEVSSDMFSEGNVVSYSLADDLHTMIDLGMLTKTLYLSESYPDLGDSSVFSIRSLLVNNDTNMITVVGNIFRKV